MFDPVETCDQLQRIGNPAVHVLQFTEFPTRMTPTADLDRRGHPTVEETVENRRGICLHIAFAARQELPRTRRSFSRRRVAKHHVPLVTDIAPHRAALNVLRAFGSS